jgi:hypothetical protein
MTAVCDIITGQYKKSSRNNNVILTGNDEYALHLYKYNQRTSFLQNAHDFVDHARLFGFHKFQQNALCR